MDGLKVSLISPLPPYRSGVSLYTLGLLSGFEKNHLSFPITVVTNRFINKLEIKERNLKIIEAWTKGPIYIFQIFSTIVKEKPKIAHIQHEYFLYGGMFSSTLFVVLLMLLRLVNTKIVVTMHGVIPRRFINRFFAEAFFIPKYITLLKFGLTTLTILICKLADKIIVHTRFAKKTLHGDYKVPQRKIQVIPHGIGVSDIDLQIKPSCEKAILFFGNITPSKGLETLITAFEQIRIPDAKLIIAGGIHPRGVNYFYKICRIANSSPAAKRIHITGYIPEEKIPLLFEQCILAVFPYTCSISSSGGLSIALQYRKPVIVTNLENFREIIVDGQNGLIVPPNDSKALAEAIERIILDHNLRNRLSQGVIDKCHNIEWPVIAARTIKCYSDLLNEK